MTAAAVRPVINITHKRPGQRPVKFARVVFPEGFTPRQVAETLGRFPESEGYRCDLRQVGPQGFSLPLALGDLQGAAC